MILTRRQFGLGLGAGLLCPRRAWAQPAAPSQLWVRDMAVTFDATANGNSSGSATTMSCTLTIGSGSNRAIGIGLCFSDTATPTGVTVTVGGTSATLVSGTDSSALGPDTTTMIFVLANPASGSTTVTANWTNATYGVIGADSVTGCDQTTPMTNGTTAFTNSGTSLAIPVTSASGDLTMTCVSLESGSAPTATDRTERWRLSNAFNCGCGGDTGPGTASPTHTWTFASTATVGSGANFLAAAAGGGGRTTKNTRAWPLGTEIGMHWRAEV